MKNKLKNIQVKHLLLAAAIVIPTYLLGSHNGTSNTLEKEVIGEYKIEYLHTANRDTKYTSCGGDAGFYFWTYEKNYGYFFDTWEQVYTCSDTREGAENFLNKLAENQVTTYYNLLRQMKDSRFIEEKPKND